MLAHLVLVIMAALLAIITIEYATRTTRAYELARDLATQTLDDVDTTHRT